MQKLVPVVHYLRKSTKRSKVPNANSGFRTTAVVLPTSGRGGLNQWRMFRLRLER